MNRLAKRTLGGAAAIAFWLGCPSLPAQEPPPDEPEPELSAEQSERLEKRDSWWKETEKFMEAGDWEAALRATRKMMAIEREVLGETHQDYQESLKAVAYFKGMLERDAAWDTVLERSEQKDWKPALVAASKVLAIERELLEEDDADVLDTLKTIEGIHLALDDVPAARTALQQRIEAAQKIRTLDPWEAEDLRQRDRDLAFMETVSPEERRLILKLSTDHQEALEMANRGSVDEALRLSQSVYEQRRRIYTKDSHPHGHRRLAASLGNVGSLHLGLRDYGKAKPFLRDALEMNTKLYPKSLYPDGHPNLVSSLHNLGAVHAYNDEVPKALPLLLRAVKMNHRLHPPERYPDGPPGRRRLLQADRGPASRPG